MKEIHDLQSLRDNLTALRKAGRTIAFVPTMGNLHAGHLALVDHARTLADMAVASIYVNPAQFGPGEDFVAYPRTPKADLEALRNAGCDLVWMPGDEVMYPRGLADAVRVKAPPALADVLCGAGRPGHFDGVVTVVTRLFNQVRPDIAVFGEKDYQQLLIIHRLVDELSLDIRVESLATVREPDGLAMSSRNRYLTPEERKKATEIFRQLKLICDQLHAEVDLIALERQAFEILGNTGLIPEYVAIRRADDLGAPESSRPLRVFVAAQLGKARLIDNIAPRI